VKRPLLPAITIRNDLNQWASPFRHLRPWEMPFHLQGLPCIRLWHIFLGSLEYEVVLEDMAEPVEGSDSELVPIDQVCCKYA
jgi:hypothetical protein